MIEVNPLTDNEEEFITQVKAVLYEVRMGNWNESNFRSYIDNIDKAIEAIKMRVTEIHKDARGLHLPVYFDLVNALALYKSLIEERVFSSQGS